MPPFYIGSTSIIKVENGYHGTIKSKLYKKVWRNEIISKPQLFTTKILCRFNDRQDSLDRECQLQKRVGIPNNPMYINQATAHGKFGLLVSGFRQSHSNKTRERISQKMKELYRDGKVISPFASLDYTGVNNPFYGKKHSEETRQLMSKPKSFIPKQTCQHCKGSFSYGNYSQWHGDKCRFSNPLYEKQKRRTQSEAAKQRQRVSCPHCCKVGSISQMKRWHLERCRLKPSSVDQHCRDD